MTVSHTERNMKNGHSFLNQIIGTSERPRSGRYANIIKGWGDFGNGKRYYFRSKWEFNYARYLEWLRVRGEILDWEYEPQTFWFLEIKRGSRSYTPDFRVVELSKRYRWHEVKGHMDSKSKTKLARMHKYYPHEDVIVISQAEYKEVMKFDKLFPQVELVVKK